MWLKVVILVNLSLSLANSLEILTNGYVKEVEEKLRSIIKEKKVELEGVENNVQGYMCAKGVSLEGIDKFTVKETLPDTGAGTEDTFVLDVALVFDDLRLKLKKIAVKGKEDNGKSVGHYFNKQQPIKPVMVHLMISSKKNLEKSGHDSLRECKTSLDIPPEMRTFLPGPQGDEGLFSPHVSSIITTKHNDIAAQFYQTLAASVRSAVIRTEYCEYGGIIEHPEDKEGEDIGRPSLSHVFVELCGKDQDEKLVDKIIKSMTERVKSRVADRVDVEGLEFHDKKTYVCANEISIQGIQKFITGGIRLEPGEKDTVVVRIPLIFNDLQLYQKRVGMSEKKLFFRHKKSHFFDQPKFFKIEEQHGCFLKLSYKKTPSTDSHDELSMLKDCEISLDNSGMTLPDDTAAKIYATGALSKGGELGFNMHLLFVNNKNVIFDPFFKTLAESLAFAVQSDERCKYKGETYPKNWNPPVQTSKKEDFQDLCVKQPKNKEIPEDSESMEAGPKPRSWFRLKHQEKRKESQEPSKQVDKQPSWWSVPKIFKPKFNLSRLWFWRRKSK